MTSFGEELKRERELRDISLKEISEATKISIRFLEALEHNNFDILPGGIFNRGFIRSYARFIGVDGEEMVNAYLHEISLKESGKTPTAAGAAITPDTAGVFRQETRRVPAVESRVEVKQPSVFIKPESRFPTGSRSEDAGGRASMAIWIMVVLALFAGAAGLLTMRMSGNRTEQPSSGSHVQAVKARMNKQPPAAASVTSPETAPNALLAQEAPGGEPVAGTDPNSQTTTEGGLADNPDTTTPNAGSEPLAAPPVIEHQVVVRVNETTGIIIVCAGQVSLAVELWAGGSKRLSCAEPVVLSADNGGAVEFSLDGGPIALLGAMGERVESRIVAPIPEPAEAPKSATGTAGEAHAGN